MRFYSTVDIRHKVKPLIQPIFSRAKSESNRIVLEKHQISIGTAPEKKLNWTYLFKRGQGLGMPLDAFRFGNSLI